MIVLRSYPNKVQLLPLKLTEIAESEAWASFNSTPAVYSGGLLQPHSSTCTYGPSLHSTVHFRTRRGHPQRGPVSAMRRRGCRTECLTTLLTMESSWMPPRSTWGTEVMLEEFAAAESRHIVKARTWFALNNLLMSFFKGETIEELRSDMAAKPLRIFKTFWVRTLCNISNWGPILKCLHILRNAVSFHNFISMLSIFTEFLENIILSETPCRKLFSDWQGCRCRSIDI